MNWELIIGLAGLIVWGIVCSIYIWRQREVTLTMMLPFSIFLLLISIGWGQM